MNAVHKCACGLIEYADPPRCVFLGHAISMPAYPFVVENKPSLLMKYFDMVKNRMNMGRLAMAAMAIMIPSSLWVSAMNLVMYSGIVFISSL